MAPRKPSETMVVRREQHNNLLFLWNEVQLTADKMLTADIGTTFQSFTCEEVEALACIFAAAGRQDVYDFIIHQHSLGDEAEEIDWHLAMYGDTAPPKPLGKEHAHD